MPKRRKKNFIQKIVGKKGLDLELDLNEDVVREIFAIGWIVIGLIILLAEFNAAGLVGQKLFFALRFLIGLVAFIIPFLVIWVGFSIGKFFSVKLKFRAIIGILIILFSLPSLLHLLSSSDPVMLARAGRGGGVFGYLISFRLTQILGGAGAYLISIAASVIGLLLTFNLSLGSLVARFLKENGQEGGQSPSESISLFSSVKRTIGGLRENIRPAKARVLEMPSTQNPSATDMSDSDYILPTVETLESSDQVASPGNINKNADIIKKTLKDFNIDVTMAEANVGPTVTQYTMKPAEGVKLNQITARANDLALALAAKSIRIEAPIPGKSAVGIEIPNMIAAKVTLREMLQSGDFSKDPSPLTLALGRDVAGGPVIVDLEKMPHLLIAGATGSGKSVCINTLILALLFRNTPTDLRFVMVDPKRVELTNYNGIAHLLSPVITEADKTVAALRWTVGEMERRYRILADTGKKNIVAYNQARSREKMPYIIFIVDELADLMAVSAREVEGSIVRLAQMARATGIHLILATQRPSVDVITGLIKANITSRIAFAVASNADSRTILDQSGAEKLLGNGDMLYLGSDLGKPKRIQGAFASDKDLGSVIKHIRSQGVVQYNEEITVAKPIGPSGNGGFDSVADDDLYAQAADTVKVAGKASASLLQRRLRIGYARAARLLDLLEENGIIGPADGAKPREVYGGGSTDQNRYFDDSNY